MSVATQISAVAQTSLFFPTFPIPPKTLGSNNNKNHGHCQFIDCPYYTPYSHCSGSILPF